MATPVISADSHVMEPGDLWSERLDKRFGDRAPQSHPLSYSFSDARKPSPRRSWIFEVRI